MNVLKIIIVTISWMKLEYQFNNSFLCYVLFSHGVFPTQRELHILTSVKFTLK